MSNFAPPASQMSGAVEPFPDIYVATVRLSATPPVISSRFLGCCRDTSSHALEVYNSLSILFRNCHTDARSIPISCLSIETRGKNLFKMRTLCWQMAKTIFQECGPNSWDCFESRKTKCFKKDEKVWACFFTRIEDRVVGVAVKWRGRWIETREIDKTNVLTKCQSKWDKYHAQTDKN